MESELEVLRRFWFKAASSFYPPRDVGKVIVTFTSEGGEEGAFEVDRAGKVRVGGSDVPTSVHLLARFAVVDGFKSCSRDSRDLEVLLFHLRVLTGREADDFGGWECKAPAFDNLVRVHERVTLVVKWLWIKMQGFALQKICVGGDTWSLEFDCREDHEDQPRAAVLPQRGEKLDRLSPLHVRWLYVTVARLLDEHYRCDDWQGLEVDAEKLADKLEQHWRRSERGLFSSSSEKSAEKAPRLSSAAADIRGEPLGEPRPCKRAKRDDDSTNLVRCLNRLHCLSFATLTLRETVPRVQVRYTVRGNDRVATFDSSGVVKCGEERVASFRDLYKLEFQNDERPLVVKGYNFTSETVEALRFLVLAVQGDVDFSPFPKLPFFDQSVSMLDRLRDVVLSVQVLDGFELKDFSTDGKEAPGFVPDDTLGGALRVAAKATRDEILRKKGVGVTDLIPRQLDSVTPLHRRWVGVILKMSVGVPFTLEVVDTWKNKEVSIEMIAGMLESERTFEEEDPGVRNIAKDF